MCMKRGVPSQPGVVNEHMTDATITGFPPQLNCNWYTLDGAIITVEVAFYGPGAYAAIFASLAFSITWAVRRARRA